MIMNYDHLKIENQLCFALYASSKAIIKMYKPLLDKLGITYTQYITLLVLWEQDNISVREIGNILHLDSGTLTPLLKRLETMGIIERIRDPKDQRNVNIKLTKKGIEMKKEASAIPEKILCNSNLSLNDALELKEKLRLLLNDID